MMRLLRHKDYAPTTHKRTVILPSANAGTDRLHCAPVLPGGMGAGEMVEETACEGQVVALCSVAGDPGDDCCVVPQPQRSVRGSAHVLDLRPVAGGRHS